MATRLVTCSDLAVDYGDFRALDQVNLDFGNTGVTGLIGVNGAGKTTLIHAMSGLIPRSAGTVSMIEGTNIIGYCPDTPTFEPWLSAPEVLEQSVALTAQPKPDPESIAATLQTVGLGEVGERRVGGFSRGMKQRLGVAAALILKPRLLFLDEPTSALDPVGRDEMLELIEVLGQELHVVFSSHLLGDVQRVADSLVVIHQGQVRYQGLLASFLGGADPVIEIDTDASPQALCNRLSAAGIAAVADPTANRVEVGAEAKADVFALLAEIPDGITAVRVHTTSLQAAFRAEIEDGVSSQSREASHA